MKKLLFVVLLGLIGPSVSTAEAGVSFGIFYSSLGAYGDWISIGADVYAWRPAHVDEGWRPYTVGRWIWTDDGWYWASDEPWGWAAYHYGRWYFDDYNGWVWVPGYDWAPAWVEWRYGGDYIGWAPLSPYAVFNLSFGIHYTRHWVTPYSYWSFVDCHYIGSPNVHRYVYRTDNNTRFIGRTRGAGSVSVDGGRVITRGPERGYVERRGNVRLPRAEITDVNDRQQERLTRNGDRERIEAYRPRFDERSRTVTGERPARVRESSRPLSLDTRHMDVGARDVARSEGRDLQRAEQYRSMRGNERRPDDLPAVTPRGTRRDMPEMAPRTLERRPNNAPLRIDRPVERIPEARGTDAVRPRSERNIERMPDRRREPIDRPPRMQREERREAPQRSYAPPARHEGSRSVDAPRSSSGSRGGGGGRRR